MSKDKNSDSDHTAEQIALKKAGLVKRQASFFTIRNSGLFVGPIGLIMGFVLLTSAPKTDMPSKGIWLLLMGIAAFTIALIMQAKITKLKFEIDALDAASAEKEAKQSAKDRAKSKWRVKNVIE